MIGIGCKETMCTSCSHREVCFLKEEFLKAQKAVDNVQVCRTSNGDEATCMILLRDIPWIKPIELTCIYYSKKVPQIKETVR